MKRICLGACCKQMVFLAWRSRLWLHLSRPRLPTSQATSPTAGATGRSARPLRNLGKQQIRAACRRAGQSAAPDSLVNSMLTPRWSTMRLGVHMTGVANRRPHQPHKCKSSITEGGNAATQQRTLILNSPTHPIGGLHHHLGHGLLHIAQGHEMLH